MNPATALSVVQGVASKKLMLVMWVLYLLSGVAEKMPAEAMRCVYVMAALAGVFLACQTALDFRRIGSKGDGADPDDTMVPGLGLGSEVK